MNAQVAVALDRTGAFSSNFVSDRLPVFRTLEVSSEPAQKAVWLRRAEGSPLSVTLEQLRETETFDGHLAATDDPAPAYKVLGTAGTAAFSLGGDLALFSRCIEEGDRKTLEEYAELAAAAIWTNVSAHAERRILTIAAVAGEAQGGGFEAALSCNTLVAERGTFFGFPESLFGMFPGMGGELLLATRVDADVAARMVKTANRYSAEFLSEIGVIDYLVEPGMSAKFVARLLMRAVTDPGDVCNRRMALRQAQLDRVRREAIEASVARWLERAVRLDARHLRTMKYILEMQARLAA